MDSQTADAPELRDREEIARVFAPVLRRHPHARLALFGSRARGDARRASDIDLALVSLEPLPAAEMAALREALEESRVPWRIDLVDYASAPAELRAAIDRESIAWPA